ncbi:MAG: L,D-transpeptidase family protein [Chloroflexi bacterium]|nr:L,D-transpeptidase family protein [Chloroflexota bacterium]
MRAFSRRFLLRSAGALPFVAAASTLATPAFADTTIVNQNGQWVSRYTAGTNAPWTGWLSSGGVGYTYVYLFSQPNTGSVLLASLPVNQPVTVIGYAPGEVLAPPNPLWYQVRSSADMGWVYSGLLSNVAPILLPASKVAPPPGPIPGPLAQGKCISISLSRQHMWAYQNGQVFLDTDVTTGEPGHVTPTGTFTILQKVPNFKFISLWPAGSPNWYPDSPTHYAMLFRDGGYYIHDAPWRPYYGPGTDFPHLDPDGTVRSGSHGCVNTPLKPMLALAAWTDLGTPVLIID